MVFESAQRKPPIIRCTSYKHVCVPPFASRSREMYHSNWTRFELCTDRPCRAGGVIKLDSLFPSCPLRRQPCNVVKYIEQPPFVELLCVPRSRRALWPYCYSEIGSPLRATLFGLNFGKAIEVRCIHFLL